MLAFENSNCYNDFVVEIQIDVYGQHLHSDATAELVEIPTALMKYIVKIERPDILSVNVGIEQTAPSLAAQ